MVVDDIVSGLGKMWVLGTSCVPSRPDQKAAPTLKNMFGQTNKLRHGQVILGQETWASQETGRLTTTHSVYKQFGEAAAGCHMQKVRVLDVSTGRSQSHIT